jgi:hypothetical protein
MHQYKNRPIHYLYFGDEIPGQRRHKCMTMKVILYGHIQFIRVVKRELRIYRNNQRISFEEFRSIIPYNHPPMQPLMSATLKEIVNFDLWFTTHHGRHLNGPIELIIEVNEVEYKIKSSFAKLM